MYTHTHTLQEFGLFVSLLEAKKSKTTQTSIKTRVPTLGLHIRRQLQVVLGRPNMNPRLPQDRVVRLLSFRCLFVVFSTPGFFLSPQDELSFCCLFVVFSLSFLRPGFFVPQDELSFCCLFVVFSTPGFFVPQDELSFCCLFVGGSMPGAFVLHMCIYMYIQSRAQEKLTI